MKKGILPLLAGAAIALLAVFMPSCSKKAPPLVVLTSGDIAPFAMVDKEGTLCGFDVDLIKMLAKCMNRDIEFKSLPFEDVMNGIKTKQGDVALGGISITKEREEIFDLTATGHSGGFVLLALESTVINSLADLCEKMIGVRAGSLQESKAKREWDDNYRNLFVKSYKSFNSEEIVAKLRGGELAAIVLDIDEAKYIAARNNGLKIVPLDAGTFEMGFVTTKGSVYSDEISKFMKENKEKVDELEIKWFSAKSDFS
ncbi:MAG: transporter substrate-binding domain-containing protein [Holosporales bacterium]|jgi:polar amino acid transport system substrate-binding protein|nr:transporter substrate-binding domain-containing protein [Holosporales bacterium]